MMLHQFLDELGNLSEERHKEGFKKLFDELLRNPDQYEGFLFDILSQAVELESDDYFGTEGLDV